MPEDFKFADSKVESIQFVLVLLCCIHGKGTQILIRRVRDIKLMQGGRHAERMEERYCALNAFRCPFVIASLCDAPDFFCKPCKPPENRLLIVLVFRPGTPDCRQGCAVCYVTIQKTYDGVFIKREEGIQRLLTVLFEKQTENWYDKKKRAESYIVSNRK